METSNENKQDVMVSNLPLLFSDGNPTSIGSMSAEDLQYFVTFLMKCILGVEPSNWSMFPRFKWWPADIPWSSIILSKKHINARWREKLKNIVRRCYEYNGCTYLLNFSSKLQQLIGGFKYTDNWDGTTSMYDISSGKLLVTFRNENMNYDKSFRQQNSAQRPMLLPRLNSPNSPTKLKPATPKATRSIEAPSTAKMVEPPVCDIFLCDYCGADFNTVNAIKVHEKKCTAEKVSETQSTCNFMEVEVKNLDQTKFLWYLSLSGHHHTLPPSCVTPIKTRSAPVKKTYTLSDRRYTTIPFSSNLGQSFFKMSKLNPAASEALVSRYERFCLIKPRPAAGPLGRTGPPTLPPGEGNNNNLIAAKPISNHRGSTQKRREECWSHSYSFSIYDRRERMKTIATGLNARARELLEQCIPARVVIERLKPDEIEWWRRPKDLNHTTLLHPFVQRSIASLPSTCNVSLASTHSSMLQPFILMGRCNTNTDAAFNQQNLIAVRTRSPPGLLPLITSAWSLQTMESVQPNNRNQFHLPDLIPIHSKTQPRSSTPVVIKMPTASPPGIPVHSALQNSLICGESNMLEVNLCSSEDELDTEERNGINVSNSLFLPPGTSVTKIWRQREAALAASKLHNGAMHQPSEPNNNRSRNKSRWVPSTGTLTAPAVCENANHSNRFTKSEPLPSITLTPIISADCSLPIVTPLKLGRLPAAKLKQMKQSLLKIQQEEGKSPNLVLEKTPQVLKGKDAVGDSLQSVTVSNVNKALTQLLGDECKELRHRGLEDLLFSNQRITRRKRTNSDPIRNAEDDQSQALLSKIRKLEQIHSVSAHFGESQEDKNENDVCTNIIEVDVAGPYILEERHDERASSNGSLTPDSHIRKNSEVYRLLQDECKGLRNKGLENLAHTGQRITRRSLPLARNKK